MSVSEKSYDRSRGSRSRSTSVETCIRNTEIFGIKNVCELDNNASEDESDEELIDELEETSEVDLPLISKFTKGAYAATFSSTPFCTVIGFELKEAMGAKTGVLGALLVAAASALFGGILSSIMLSFSKPIKSKVENFDSQPIEIDHEPSNHQNEDLSKKTSQKTELTEEDIEFIMENTDFNRDSVLRWFSAFKEQCPDCLLDRPNFISFYKNLIPGNSEVKDEFADAVFQAFDFDNNGYVDFGEFLIAFWVKAKGGVRNKLLWLFEVYDNDKSGFISMTELTHMLRLVFSLKSMSDDPAERAQYVMKLVDVNSDGQLSKAEFIEGCMMDEELRELLET